MVLPAVVVALLLVLQAGVLGADIVAAQGLARDAARAAAIGPRDETADLSAAVAGDREVEVSLQPSREGGLVTAHVRMRSRAFGNVGVDVWVPGRATMRTEHR